MDSIGQQPGILPPIVANPDAVKRAGMAIAEIIIETAVRMPKGARRAIAFAFIEALLYGLAFDDDLESAIRGKAEMYLAKLAANVPTEQQRRTGSIIELMEGVELSDLDDDPDAKRKSRSKGTSLEASNKRLMKELERGAETIADLTAQVTHLRDMQRKQPAASLPIKLHAASETNSALIQRVRELEQEKQDIAARLAQALRRIVELEDETKRSAVRPKPQQAKPAREPQAPEPRPEPRKSRKVGHETRRPIVGASPSGKVALTPWAESRFAQIAKLTGVTIERFTDMVRVGLIESWRNAQIARGAIDTYQSRWVNRIAQQISEQFSFTPVERQADKPARKPRQRKTKPAVASVKNPPKPIVLSWTVVEANPSVLFSVDSSFRMWFAAVHNVTKLAIEDALAMTREGTFDAWVRSNIESGVLGKYPSRFAKNVGRFLSRLYAESNGGRPLEEISSIE